MNYLKALLMLSAIFCLTTLGVLFLNLSIETKTITASLLQTSATIQKTTKDVDEYATATMNSVQGVMEVTSGTLNDIDTTVENEQTSIKQANQSTVKAMQDLDILVQNADASQKTVIAAVQQTLTSVQKTTESAIPVMDQTQKDLASLQPVIVQAQEMVKQSTDTMAHISASTADIETEIHRFVFPPPQPWYKKYIWNPVKMASHVLTVPVTSF